MGSPTASGLADVPDHLADDPFYWDRAEISAVCAINLRPPHLESLAFCKDLLHPLDQGAELRLTKDDHIPHLDITHRKRNTRGQHIVTRFKIRVQAEAADFQQSQDQI